MNLVEPTKHTLWELYALQPKADVGYGGHNEADRSDP